MITSNGTTLLAYDVPQLLTLLSPELTQSIILKFKYIRANKKTG